ncbi:DUF3231 family protein [Ammoniphilus sp. YIM 78166]|uniref:DUF3231 family protein n=1 Tax=Ammoniphilus sp. YIM 78166 TaxID=1644106 RepID=UPI00106F66BB|nr:DUF3231 family protein [Ammoniphilus sp. YIM 78166]
MSNKITLSPSEISNLWNVYLTETMTTHVTKYLIKMGDKDDDQFIKTLEFALDISQMGVEVAADFFKRANFPLPEGFSEQDINWDAPKIYSDNAVILVKKKLVEDALVANTLSLGSSFRKEIRDFFEKQLVNGTKLLNMLLDLIYQRGLLHPLHISTPERIEKVKHSFLFLGGIMEGNRPLNTAEVFNLELNFHETEVLSLFFKSFAQFDLTKDKKLDQHFLRGAEIMDKHLQLFQNRLSESELPELPTWESELGDSTISPFSDRLMLFKSAVMLSATASRYGVALSTVMRKDIGTDFARLMTETLKYAEDNMNIMIEKGYFDEHPSAKK